MTIMTNLMRSRSTFTRYRTTTTTTTTKTNESREQKEQNVRITTTNQTFKRYLYSENQIVNASTFC